MEIIFSRKFAKSEKVKFCPILIPKFFFSHNNSYVIYEVVSGDAVNQTIIFYFNSEEVLKYYLHGLFRLLGYF